MSRPPLAVLVVGPDAEALAAGLSGQGGLDTAAAGSAESAEACLDGTAFDVVLAQGDSLADRLRERVRDRGLTTTVLCLPVGEVDVVAWAARLRGGGGPSAPADVREALASVRDEIGRVVHALNNPLAVIVGNAQLAQELARAVETDPTIVGAIDDIAHAGEELGRLFDRIRDLRASVEAVIRRD